MKREGRQHGVVRSYPILPSPLSQHQRYVKTVDSTLVTGLFTKVSRKPTNQSKFTGKCGTARCNGCHIHPATKSKDKAKGTMKFRSIGSDGGLISFGASATSTLAYLANDESYDDHDEYEGDYDQSDNNCHVDFGIGLASIVTKGHIGVDNEDELVSYCDVELCLGDLDGDDGWYLVGHDSQ